MRQDYQILGNELDRLLTNQQQAPNEITKGFIQARMDELFAEREKLQARLNNKGSKSDHSDLEQAKERPMEDFLKFNRAGFANCPFHGPEKTPSFHKIPRNPNFFEEKERGYCFSCQKKADVIDVVQQLNNCTLPEAIKIILNK